MNLLQHAIGLLLKSYYKNALSLEDLKNFIPSYFPYKGYGRIVVSEKDLNKAIDLIKSHVGEYEFNYYPEHLIVSESENRNNFNYGSVYLGKFDIENLEEFLEKLIKETTVISFYFNSEEI